MSTHDSGGAGGEPSGPHGPGAAPGQPGVPGSGEPHGPASGDPDGQELRVLLERAVPQLPSPARRMEQVRARVRRRARRRAVGLPVAAVLAVAAVGLQVPGLTGPLDKPDILGSPVPSSSTTTLAPPASGSAPAPSRPPATEPPTSIGSHVYTFPELSGLRMSLPPGWSTLRPTGTNASFVSSQQLAQPPAGCAHALDGFCTPLAKSLAPGGVLLMLSPQKGLAGKFVESRDVSRADLLDACRGVGGTDQLDAMISTGSGSGAMVTAVVCLSRPTEQQVQQVEDALTNAYFL